jgi:sirohydrochlorin ferrochelatase
MNRLRIIASLSLLVFTATAFSQQPTNAAIPKGTGILLLAHGGSKTWNAEVMKIASAVDKEAPVEVAFGMASRRTLQEGIDKLQGRGVTRIVAVPLFISSHSSVITSTEYLLGQRKEAPADLAIFAKMDHSHGMGGASSHDGTDGTAPVKSPIPLRMTSALDGDSLVADILLARAASISKDPANEVVILVAHGPTPDDDNLKWLVNMKILAEFMKPKSQYKRIEYLTVRDDAPDSIRAEAASDLRALVEGAKRDSKKVLIVPLLLSYGGIEEGIRKRLEGLDYTISQHGLLPDERLVQWVKNSVVRTAQ